MKLNKVKLYVTLTLSLLTVGSITAYASDTATVVFQNNKQIVLTDLFNNFQGVMPGDSLVQEISIQNDCSEYDFIKVYLKAQANTEDNIQSISNVTSEDVDNMNEFLSNLKMTVNINDTEIFKDSPDVQGTLANNVLLSTLNENESVSLDVELDVPITLGNEFENEIGEVDWVFTVEAYEEPPTKEPTIGGLIQTGQWNWPIFVMGGLGTLFIVLGGFSLRKKRGTKDV